MTYPTRHRLACIVVVLVLAFGGAGVTLASEPSQAETTTPIEHLVVLIQSNHTFDNYFGTYPGADGIPEDACMPRDPNSTDRSNCVEPFHTGNQSTQDLNHSPDTFLQQFNNGRMDGFVYSLDQLDEDGTRTMGYYNDSDLPYYWNLADEYVIFDRYFSSARGGSVWNRMYALAGVPGNVRNQVPAGGFGDIQTIFDRLQERGISWKFYVQNYDPTVNFRNRTGHSQATAQVQWVPLLNFDRFLDDPELSRRIVDFSEYSTDLENGTLPAVSYVVALGATEHPPGDPLVGQRFVKRAVQALMVSDHWESSAFFVTYDDWGGWYDHVPPPQVDEYGYGFRVPAFVVSAYARRGFIDSTELDHTSILKFIEENWSIEPLAERDARANSFAGAFDFQQEPRDPVFISLERTDDSEAVELRRAAIYLVYGAGMIFAGAAIGWPTLRAKSKRSSR